jgi:hypothetical protein
MNALWPILVIVLGAVGWYLIKYLAAPKPFEVALICVVVLLLLVWLVGVFGGGLYVPRISAG